MNIFAFIISVCAICLFVLWASKADAADFVEFTGCTLTEGSDYFSGYHISGRSVLLGKVLIRRESVMMMNQIPDVNPEIDCTRLTLSTGRTIFVIGNREEVRKKVYE